MVVNFAILWKFEEEMDEKAEIDFAGMTKAVVTINDAKIAKAAGFEHE